MFPIAHFSLIPKVPRAHPGAECCVGDSWKKWRKPFPEKSCSIRLKESRKCCPLSLSCLSPLQDSDNRKADISEQNLYSKHIYWNIEHNGKQTRSPFVFQAMHLPPLNTGPPQRLRIGWPVLGPRTRGRRCCQNPRRAPQQLPSRAIF